jgi:hypothetical protein
MIVADTAFNVGERVRLTKTTHLNEEALVIERIERQSAAQCYSAAAAGSDVSGPSGTPYWYRVLVIRTEEELLVGHDWLAPL